MFNKADKIWSFWSGNYDFHVFEMNVIERKTYQINLSYNSHYHKKYESNNEVEKN